MARIRHPRPDGLRQMFLAALLFALLSPTVFSLGLRAPWALPADFTDQHYLCTEDTGAALADLNGGRDPDRPLFQDPACSLCVVLATAVCPEPALAAPLAVTARYLALRPAATIAPALARIALPPEARGPPRLI
ncbi:MAG: hypothetical protein K0B00_13640 [Rhodobacteraceae bacterium]|nr:hypothetical protein [Paracoccaceae bacterium]